MRPLEPIRLDDPPVTAGKAHPPTTAPEKLPTKDGGKADPPPQRPLTYGQTFGAVFLAILAAWLVISIVGGIIAAIEKEKRANKEIDELLHRP